MQDITLIEQFILSKCGGVSNAKTDEACHDPVPDGSGNHTNKDVTWGTFAGLASQLGYVATPALFYQMPPDIWGKILRNGFFGPIGGEVMKTQVIAFIVSEFAWGSGDGPAVRKAKQVLAGMAVYGPFNIYDGRPYPGFIAACDKADPVKFINAFHAAKLAFYKLLPTDKDNDKGWAARAEALRELLLKHIGAPI